MSIGKSASRISLVTFLSRIFGLVREQLFAALLGAGYFADAFVIAFRIPNLLRDLFAEGALSNAFVPTFTEYRIVRSQDEAWKLANLVLGVLLLLISGITILGIIFAPWIVSLIAPGFSQESGKHLLTTQLTQIMMPFLLFISIAALLMGMLNSFKSYAIPAFAPVVFNIVSISVGLLLWAYTNDPYVCVLGWAAGTLLAGMAQAGIQLPKLRSLGWRVRPTLQNWRTDAGLRRIMLLMLPAIIANSGTHVNVLVNSILASMLQEGSASWLNYAFRLMQLPIGVFGVAISTVALASSSENMANKSMDEMAKNINSALSLSLLLTLPCAFAFLAIGEPIIQLIFERGAFNAYDTHATAAAIYFYALGLPAYSIVKILAPLFFVFNSSKTPMVASLIGISCNIAFNLFSYKHLGHRGLALGTSIGMMVNVSILFFYLQTKHLRLDIIFLIKRTLLFVWASLTISFIAFLIAQKLPNAFMKIAVSMLVSVPVYFGILYLCGVSELRTLAQKLRHRVKSS